MVKILQDVSIYLRYLRRDGHVRGRELLRRFPQYSRTSIYRHASKPVGEPYIDKRSNNKGRPKLLTGRDKRAIDQEIPKLRRERGAYTVKSLMVATGLDDRHISQRSVNRYLNEQGLRYLHSRKKGLMNEEDLIKRVEFAKKVKGVNSQLWTEGISFYLDGVGFAHKTNPRDEAMALKGMAWRRKCEGLERGYTAKGKKEGVNGRTAKYIVCIAFGKGVICCHRYQEMNGQFFSQFILENFPLIFSKSNSPYVKRFLQDGDPSQNSKLARDAMKEVGATVFPIPPRSPDINPIENVFNVVRAKLHEEAITKNISSETYEEFCDRVEQTLLNFDKSVIDKTILSMNERMDLIIKGKGKRLKY